MSYWRMQLHPGDSAHAIKYTVESLAAGYIGLDFDEDTGDMMKLTKPRLPRTQTDYWDFAHKMKNGDLVLIIAHHFPFALATVGGQYNYIKKIAPELGVWFRHFRKVKNVKYYADYFTYVRSWQQLRMTDTISPLIDPGSSSYQLIEEWGNA